MFCEYCGKKLNEGEICKCRHAQQEYRKNSPQPKMKKTSSALKFNVLTLVSYLILACGGVLAYYLNFNSDNILTKISILDKYQMYLSYLIPAVILAVGFIAACISLRKPVFRKGAVISLILNLLLAAAVIGMMFWNQHKIRDFMQEVITADADTKSLKEYYDKSIKKNESLNDKTIEELKTQINAVTDDFESGKLSYDEAKQQLSNIKELGIAPTEVESAVSKIEELEASYNAFTEAGKSEEEKDYKNALIQYGSVIKRDKNYNKAQEKIESIREVVRSDAKGKADALLEENKYAEGFQAIDSAMEILGSDDELEQMRKDNEDKYVEYVLGQANSLIEARKIADAENILTQAQKAVQRNEISSKLNELGQYKPVNLSELRVIDSQRAELQEGLSKDSYGNEYNDALIMSPYVRRDPADIYLNVNGRYNRLKGTIAPHEDMYSESGDDPCRFKIEIYADGNLVYTSGEFTKTTAPADFLADISGAKVVQIRAQHVNEGSGGTKGIIGNAKFSNE